MAGSAYQRGQKWRGIPELLCSIHLEGEGRRQSSGSRIVSNIWPPRYYYVALGQITDFCPRLGSSEEFQIFSCQLKMKKLSPNRRALLANYRWELLRNEGGLGGWEIRFDLCEDLV